jgi:DNA polymerase III subunit delta
MHAFELIKDPAQVEALSFCAVYGDEPYLRREVLNALTRGFLGGVQDEMAVARFQGDRASLANVLDELRTLPFLVKRRVALVEDADAFVTAHRKELETLADGRPTPGALILVVKTWPSNTRLAKLVAKVGLAIECKSPSERELSAWLVQLAKRQSRVKLQADAAALLLELVGPDVGLLAAEVEKLAVFVGQRKDVTREDVATMVGAGRVYKIWHVLEAAATGKSASALADIDRLMASGEHPVGLLAALTSSLRKVHHAGQLRRARATLEEACREAGIAPFAFKSTGEQHAHLGPARVDRLPALLLQADLDLKGATSLTPETVMERLIVQLARKRSD